MTWQLQSKFMKSIPVLMANSCSNSLPSGQNTSASCFGQGLFWQSQVYNVELSVLDCRNLSTCGSKEALGAGPPLSDCVFFFLNHAVFRQFFFGGGNPYFEQIWGQDSAGSAPAWRICMKSVWKKYFLNFLSNWLVRDQECPEKMKESQTPISGKCKSY